MISKTNKMKSTLLFFMLCFTITAFGQTKVTADLDGDTTPDRFEIITTDQGFKIGYALSTQGSKPLFSQVVTSAGDETKVSVNKNVVTLTIGYMRAIYTYKFRYDPKLKQIKVIGYDNEQFGNAANDGAGMSSYNLLTGGYVAQWNHYDEKKKVLVADPKISKKLPLKDYVLKNFSDKVIDELNSVE